MKLSERVEQATGGDYSLRMEIAAALGWTKNPVGSAIAIRALIEEAKV